LFFCLYIFSLMFFILYFVLCFQIFHLFSCLMSYFFSNIDHTFNTYMAVGKFPWLALFQDVVSVTT
jgi:hypothetical protein